MATMDRKFQDRRRANMTRNRPKHAIYGVTQGVNQFGTSIASGVAGLIVSGLSSAVAIMNSSNLHLLLFRNAQLKGLPRKA